MEMNSHVSIAVADRSHISVTRQQARRAAESLQFDETDAHRVGLVATELASNLVKHTGGQGGHLLLRCAALPVAEIELLALDKGTGMTDVTQSLVDGHSTAGSGGTGLGAVRRLADDFDIYSQPGKGTVVFTRLRRNQEPAAPAGPLLVGGVSVAKTGEDVCGDAWAVVPNRGTLTLVVIDGLGHGPLASTAARAGVAAGSAGPFPTAVEALTTIHRAMGHTRGAAGMVLAVDPQSAVVSVCGVGNVAAAILTADTVRRAASLAGILGHEVRQFREYQYPWAAGALLIVHSDGLTSHWALDGYPGLRRRHPAVIAAVLYRDFLRGRDDTTVVAVKDAS